MSAPSQVQQDIDAARRVLYVLDAQGNIVGKTPLYQRYQDNESAFLKAKQDYNNAYADALNDPVKLQNWPIAGVDYKQRVDQAYDAWRTADAQRVEQAIAILGAQGKSA